MRWRYTGNGAKAVNYDFDFSEEYFLWEELALNEIKNLLLNRRDKVGNI